MERGKKGKKRGKKGKERGGRRGEEGEGEERGGREEGEKRERRGREEGEKEERRGAVVENSRKSSRLMSPLWEGEFHLIRFNFFVSDSLPLLGLWSLSDFLSVLNLLLLQGFKCCNPQEFEKSLKRV